MVYTDIKAKYSEVVNKDLLLTEIDEIATKYHDLFVKPKKQPTNEN